MDRVREAVFREKVLEAQYGQTNDGGNDSGNSPDSYSKDDRKKEGASTKFDSSGFTTENQLEKEHGAISILEKHSDFMRKQVELAEGHKSSMKLGLVSSKRPIEAVLTAEELTKHNHGKRGKTQAEKNKNRKLKKKKAHYSTKKTGPHA